MPNSSYIPSVQSLYAEFMASIYDKLTANPTAYGLTAEQIVDFATKQEAFAAAYALAIDPTTRTQPRIAAKDAARKACTAALRPLVATMQAWPGMTNEKRDELGITVPDPSRTPVPKPTSSPLLSVVAVMGRKIKVNLRSRETSNLPSETRARPVGVRNANIYFAAGETFPTSMDGWTFKGTVSKTTFDIEIPASVPAGSQIFLTAQWLNTRSEAGPASEPVATTIGGGLQQAA